LKQSFSVSAVCKPRAALFALCFALLVPAPLALASDNVCRDTEEKCYGISKKGQDDGSIEMSVPGLSTEDYQGNAFKCVAKGTCESRSTPYGYGNLKPIDNRPPKP
jgi:uncharacterized membrane protein